MTALAGEHSRARSPKKIKSKARVQQHTAKTTEGHGWHDIAGGSVEDGVKRAQGTGNTQGGMRSQATFCAAACGRHILLGDPRAREVLQELQSDGLNAQSAPSVQTLDSEATTLVYISDVSDDDESELPEVRRNGRWIFAKE